MPLTDDALTILARHADLVLPDYAQAELASAWQHVAPMIARLHRSQPYAAEPAHVFVPSVFDPAA